MEKRVANEIRQAEQEGVIAKLLPHRAVIRKDGYTIKFEYPYTYPFKPPLITMATHDVLPVGEWLIGSTIISVWKDFTEQLGNTDDEKFLLASTSLSGLAFIAKK